MAKQSPLIAFDSTDSLDREVNPVGPDPQRRSRRVRHRGVALAAAIIAVFAVAKITFAIGEPRPTASDTSRGAEAAMLSRFDPQVVISPIGGARTSPNISVTIQWCSEWRLDSSTQYVTFRGQNVTSQFTFQEEWLPGKSCDSKYNFFGKSEAQLTLSAGLNILSASICDVQGQCGWQTVTYTYDVHAPTINFNPDGGVFPNSSLEVTIEYCDDVSLQETSRQVSLNGAPEAISFFTKVGNSKAGCGAAAIYRGTIPMLAPGTNTLVARICDSSGRCASESTSYYYDSQAPSISFQPESGRVFSSPSQSFTVNWADNYGLNPASDTIWLNNTNVTTSFTYSSSSTKSAKSTGTLSLKPGSNTVDAKICDTVGQCRKSTATYFYDSINPNVHVTFGDVVGGRLPVIIEWSDNMGLDHDSRAAFINGQRLSLIEDIDARTPTKARDSVMITLVDGSNTITAEVLDNVGRRGTATKSYQHDGVSPTITLNPGSGAWISARPTIIIEWCDGATLDQNSRGIEVHDQVMPRRVDGDFNYVPGSKPGCGSYAESKGVTDIYEDNSTVVAKICDHSGNCAQDSVTYRLDNQKPSVSFDPNGGAFAAAELPLMVLWSDNRALNAASDTIWINGVEVTHSFRYSGTSTSATSVDTVTLRPGENSIVAKICDHVGNCNSASRSYYYDNLPPGVDISFGDRFGSNLSVVIDWSDDRELNYSSRIITVNGDTVGYPDFELQNATAKSGREIGTISLRPGANVVTAYIEDGVGHHRELSRTYEYDAVKPTVTFQPASGTYVGDPAAITIEWCDNRDLRSSSMRVLVREDALPERDVGGSFSYEEVESPGCGAAAVSVGTVDVFTSSVTFVASICDFTGNCSGDVTATYTVDREKPQVAFRPASGTVTHRRSMVVEIDWSDDALLRSNSIAITVANANGTTDVTEAFSYRGGTTSATSVDTVTLALGENAYTARICDHAGNCTTETAVYTYEDQSAPTVAIDPESRSYQVASRSDSVFVPVTISWADDNGLEAASRQLTLNGNDITSSFKHEIGTVTGTSSDTLRLGVGTHTVVARIRDTSGNWSVDQTAIYEVVPPVSVTSLNPGTTIERSLCLTVAMGPAAAAECGDLRIVHELPTTRTLNKARTPTLLYNSQHAHPHPAVAANVTLPSAAAVPDSVVAVLQVAERTIRQKWNEGWRPGTTSRIVIGYDAPDDSTGIYAYTLEVTRYNGMTAVASDTATGELVVVNRTASPFGAGWWLAGLERLYFPADGNTRLWVGGDGSVRVYRKVGVVGLDTIYAAPNVDRPDTLRWIDAESRYIRYLPGGVEVRFDGMGLHRETVNRLGHVTEFHYTATQLDSIVLPVPADGGRRVYTFDYDHVTDRLLTITAPPTEDTARTVTLSYDGASRRVKGISGPDTTGVSFDYEPFTNRIDARTDRRQVTTSYAYQAGKLWQSVVDTAGLRITTELRALETVGLSPNAVTVDSAYALLDGPRPDSDVLDHTRFWLDRFGAPWKIRDALGNETVLQRGSATYPALVTRVEYPRLADGSQRVQTATYNDRGNLKTSTEVNPYGDGRNATTRYEYTDAVWPDFVTRIVPPEGDSVIISYDADGNREWMQDARGDSTRVYFNYGNPHKLLSSVVLPGGARDSVEYDALGNLHRTRTPLGFWTTYETDSIGRVRSIITPIDSVQTKFQWQKLAYDLMDRVTADTTVADSMNGVGVQSVIVENTYDAEGNLKSVSRWSEPDPAGIGRIVTRWDYDAAGRKIREWAPDGTPADSADNPVEVTYYNAAGLPDSIATRRVDSTGDAYVITMEYDALGRLIRRAIPQVDDYETTWTDGLASIDYEDSPAFGGFVIPADVHTFEYDAVGNIIRADNSDARVARSYYPNGLLKTDTLRIRTFEGDDFSKHVYVLRYGYDMNGRRIWLKHPTQLAPVVNGVRKDTTRYEYHKQSGALRAVVDPLGNRFDYTYNRRGELRSLLMPRDIEETYTYDDDGNLEVLRLDDRYGSVSGTGVATALRHTLLRYDGRGRIVRAENLYGVGDTLTVWHSGLGHLVQSHLVAHGHDVFGNPSTRTINEEFAYDALGNLTASATYRSDARDDGAWTDEKWTCRDQFYGKGTGRLVRGANCGTNADTLLYDLAGNTVFTDYISAAPDGSAPLENRASYYDAVGQLRWVDYRTTTHSYFGGLGYPPYKRVFEEYRYDALGRRVLVHSHRNCEFFDTGWIKNECQLSLIRRTIWDGQRELYEIQMPGGETESVATLENDTAEVERGLIELEFDPNPFFGRVAYTYGHGIDRPLSIIRINYRAVDRMNGNTYTRWEPFTIIPVWNYRGQADYGYFAEPGLTQCTDFTGGDCIYIAWPQSGQVYGESPGTLYSFQGTLINDKYDHAGTFYRRNRYYDPVSGRFTQEDPIGLAGGLNLYGYADGDPVTYSDPFGLRACDEDQVEIRDDCLDVLTGAPPLVTPSSALAGLARVGGVLSGGVRAARIVGQARTILGSAEMATLRSAAQAGASAEVQIAGHTIVYEHGLSASGMTLFGEKGFVLGRHAFSSAGELAKTVLHELYRLNTSSALTSGVGGATAAAETGAAAAFAERAYRIGSLLRFW